MPQAKPSRHPALEALLGERQTPTRRQLLELTDYLEDRLATMGEEGDCAYERAMSRLYTTMVEDRKRQLAALPLVPPA